MQAGFTFGLLGPLLFRMGSGSGGGVHGKLCIQRITVRPALSLGLRVTPSLLLSAEAQPALLGKVRVNECQD